MKNKFTTIKIFKDKLLTLFSNYMLIVCLITCAFHQELKSQSCDDQLIFIIDNSGSISTSEFTSMMNSTNSLAIQILNNPDYTGEIAIIQYATLSSSDPSHLYDITVPFSNSVADFTNWSRAFGANGSNNSGAKVDHLSGSLGAMRMAGVWTTAGSLPLVSNNPKFFLFTDASATSESCCSTLDNDVTEAEYDSDVLKGFGEINVLKSEYNSEWTIHHVLEGDPAAWPAAEAEAAAVASVGGDYTGPIKDNPGDPEGNQVSPRKYCNGGFNLSNFQINMLIGLILDGCCPMPTIISQLQNASGDYQSDFCYGDDIFLDGSDSDFEIQYNIELHGKPFGSSTFNFLDELSWTPGTLELIEISNVFSGWLDANNEYQLTIRLVGSCSDTITETESFFIHASKTADFHIEDENGHEQSDFCLGEDVFLNGAATSSTDSFYLALFEVNNSGDHLLSIQNVNGWALGQPDLINITDLFENDMEDPVVFTPGTTYGIELALIDPYCGRIKKFKTFTYHASGTVEFHFQDIDGTLTDEFCLGEDVYLNGSQTTNTGRYYMDLWISDNTGDQLISVQGTDGWATGHPDLINITALFENDLEDPISFVSGITYSVRLAIDDPLCGWVELYHSFTYYEAAIANFHLENALGDSISSICDTEDIYLNGTASQNEDRYTIEVYRRNIGGGGTFQFESNLPWIIGEVGIVNLFDAFLNLPLVPYVFEPGFEYEIVLIVDNEYCDESNQMAQRFILSEFVGLDPFFQILTSNASPPAYVTTQNAEPYTNTGAVHEWHIFHTPSNVAGPYKSLPMQSGPQAVFYAHLPGYWIIIHKVYTACEEACYVAIFQSPGSAPFDCSFVDGCGLVDCNIIDDLYIEENDCPKGQTCAKRAKINYLDITIYPNPSTGILNLKVQNNGTYHVHISNIVGTTIFEKNVSIIDNLQLNLENLNSGVYFVRIENLNGERSNLIWVVE